MIGLLQSVNSFVVQLLQSYNTFNYFLSAVLIILVLYKLKDFLATQSNKQSLIPTNVNDSIKSLDIKLGSFLSLFLMLFVFSLSWIVISLGNSVYEILTAAYVSKNYDFLIYLNDLEAIVKTSLITSHIMLLYGLGWLLFNRWKKNLIRKIQISYYSPVIQK